MDAKQIDAALAHLISAQSFIAAQVRIHGATALTENAKRELEKVAELLRAHGAEDALRSGAKAGKSAAF